MSTIANGSTPASRAADDPRLELSRVRTLYRLTASLAGAHKGEVVYEEALHALEGLLAARRSAILVFDAGGVMRFAAWHGLLDGYRAAVEGHSSWPRDARDPAPVVVQDAVAEPALAAYKALLGEL